MQAVQALQPLHLHFADHGLFRCSFPVHQSLQAAVVVVEVVVLSVVVVLVADVSVFEVVVLSEVVVSVVVDAVVVVVIVDVSVVAEVDDVDVSVLVIVVVVVSVALVIVVVVLAVVVLVASVHAEWSALQSIAPWAWGAMHTTVSGWPFQDSAKSFWQRTDRASE